MGPSCLYLYWENTRKLRTKQGKTVQINCNYFTNYCLFSLTHPLQFQHKITFTIIALRHGSNSSIDFLQTLDSNIELAARFTLKLAHALQVNTVYT